MKSEVSQLMKRDFHLVESVSGEWIKLPDNFRKGSCVVHLPDGIALNIDAKSSCIDIYAKSEDQVYRFSWRMVLEPNQAPTLPAST